MHTYIHAICMCVFNDIIYLTTLSPVRYVCA